MQKVLIIGVFFRVLAGMKLLIGLLLEDKGVLQKDFAQIVLHWSYELFKNVFHKILNNSLHN